MMTQKTLLYKKEDALDAIAVAEMLGIDIDVVADCILYRSLELFYDGLLDQILKTNRR